MPLRILLLTHYYLPEGGAATQRLSTMVACWVEQGAEVRVICPLPHYPYGHTLEGHGASSLLHPELGPAGEVINRVPFLATDSSGLWKLLDQVVAAVASAPVSFGGRRPDVILASVPGMPTLAAALLARMRWRVPVVVEMRDSWPDLAVEAGLVRGRVGGLLVGAVTSAQRRADAVVTVQPSFGDELALRGVNRDRIFNVPNGILPETVPALPPQTNTGPLRILYAGTIGASQGLDTFMRAMAKVGAARAVARVVGHGTEKPNLVKLATDLNAPVEFSPPVGREQVWDQYRWCDVALVPLRGWPAFHNACPSKMFEVMACGRYLLAVLSGEAESIIASTNAGSVVPPDDDDALAKEITRLAKRPLQLTVGAKPRAWVLANRDRRRLAADYLDILNRVVAGHHRNGGF